MEATVSYQQSTLVLEWLILQAFSGLLTLLLCINVISSISFPLPDPVTVFQRGEGGYYCIKIPVLLVTSNNALLAFGEGRMVSCSDFTWTDLIYKRSEDRGKTWGPLSILYSNSSAGVYNVIGNAAPVVLAESGRVLIPFCRNNRQVMLTYSDDDGLTWSRPVNLTGVTQPDWSWWVVADANICPVFSNLALYMTVLYS